jgi:hypothetical protein
VIGLRVGRRGSQARGKDNRQVRRVASLRWPQEETANRSHDDKVSSSKDEGADGEGEGREEGRKEASPGEKSESRRGGERREARDLRVRVKEVSARSKRVSGTASTRAHQRQLGTTKGERRAKEVEGEERRETRDRCSRWKDQTRATGKYKK